MKAFPIGTLILALAGLFLPSDAIGQSPSITLRSGTYVLDGVACQDPPNAAILSWDGFTFSGAHSSRCRSQIAHLEKKRYQVKLTCSARGDGSTDPMDTDYRETFELTRISNTRFRISRSGREATTYRWCIVPGIQRER